MDLWGVWALTLVSSSFNSRSCQEWTTAFRDFPQNTYKSDLCGVVRQAISIYSDVLGRARVTPKV